jgi:hypothetical protein
VGAVGSVSPGKRSMETEGNSSARKLSKAVVGLTEYVDESYPYRF